MEDTGLPSSFLALSESDLQRQGQVLQLPQQWCANGDMHRMQARELSNLNDTIFGGTNL